MSSGPDLPPSPTPITPPNISPMLYQYGSQPTADTGAVSGIQGLSGLNYAQQNYPQFQQAAGNITSGAYGAPQIQRGGNTSIAAGNSLVPLAGQVAQTAFDPRQAIYGQQFQQNTDQTRATEAAQGVAGTPYGAGVENKSNQDFNLAWQNDQLQRQLQGASAVGGLVGQQGQSATTGANLLTGAAQNPLAALSQLNTAGGSAAAIPQQTIVDFLSYLSGGTTAGLGGAGALTGLYNAESNAQTGLYSAESSAALGQQQQDAGGLAGLGQLAGGLGGWLFKSPQIAL